MNINRRSFIGGVAGLLSAPAIAKALHIRPSEERRDAEVPDNPEVDQLVGNQVHLEGTIATDPILKSYVKEHPIGKTSIGSRTFFRLKVGDKYLPVVAWGDQAEQLQWHSIHRGLRKGSKIRVLGELTAERGLEGKEWWHVTLERFEILSYEGETK